jgi:transposase
MPLRAPITSGETADCTQAHALIEGVSAQCLLADRGYDSDAIVEEAQAAKMEVVIPPRKNRKVLREYDTYLYKMRHLVENAFLHLKRWRGVATRYAKNAASFQAIVHIRCLFMWLKIL